MNIYFYKLLIAKAHFIARSFRFHSISTHTCYKFEERFERFEIEKGIQPIGFTNVQRTKRFVRDREIFEIEGNRDREIQLYFDIKLRTMISTYALGYQLTHLDINLRTWISTYALGYQLTHFDIKLRTSISNYALRYQLTHSDIKLRTSISTYALRYQITHLDMNLRTSISNYALRYQLTHFDIKLRTSNINLRTSISNYTLRFQINRGVTIVVLKEIFLAFHSLIYG